MTAIISKHGEHLYSIQGNQEIIELNKPAGCLAVSEPPRPDMQYVGGEWIDLPKRPSIFHYFNYTTKEWIDPRSLDVIKAQKWDEIKSQRDQREFGGFEFDGNIYDSDQVSQGRIMGAAIAGVDQTWTLANNTAVDLTAEELKELYTALQAHIAAAHEQGRIARQKIENAQTIQEVEAVTL